jgi:hypothetical protein
VGCRSRQQAGTGDKIKEVDARIKALGDHMGKALNDLGLTTAWRSREIKRGLRTGVMAGTSRYGRGPCVSLSAHWYS